MSNIAIGVVAHVLNAVEVIYVLTGWPVALNNKAISTIDYKITPLQVISSFAYKFDDGSRIKWANQELTELNCKGICYILE